MSKEYKFPDPNDYPAKSPAVLCPFDRVIKLYNQKTNSDAKRISKTVRAWFYQQAHQAGWAGTHFLPEVQSHHGAGCILWSKRQDALQIAITQTTLILFDSSGDE